MCGRAPRGGARVSPVRRRRRQDLRSTLASLDGPGLDAARQASGSPGSVVVGLLALAWCGWTAYRVYSDLKDARDQALILEAALARGDVDGARQANASFQDATESAAGRTDGPVWGGFEAMPVFGDDAEGLATVSDVLSDIAETGVTPVLDSAAAPQRRGRSRRASISSPSTGSRRSRRRRRRAAPSSRTRRTDWTGSTPTGSSRRCVSSWTGSATRSAWPRRPSTPPGGPRS